MMAQSVSSPSSPAALEQMVKERYKENKTRGTNPYKTRNVSNFAPFGTAPNANKATQRIVLALGGHGPTFTPERNGGETNE